MNNVTAARGGAAFTGACSPWASLSGMGMSHVLTPDPAPVVAAPDARLAAFRQIPAMTKQAAVLAVALPIATGTRQQYVHKTRVNAGGDGASGPHPEREPA